MRKSLAISLVVFSLQSGSVQAQSVIDSILAGEEYEGAQVTQTKLNLFGYTVTAVLPDGTVVIRTYRRDGTIRAQVTENNGVRETNHFTPSGEEREVASAEEIAAEAAAQNDNDNSGGGNDEDPGQLY